MGPRNLALAVFGVSAALVNLLFVAEDEQGNVVYDRHIYGREYLIVWGTATTGDIYGRRLNGNGRPLESAPFAISTAPGEQVRPSLGRHRGSGGYLTI